MSKNLREDINQGRATLGDVSGGACGEFPDAVKLIEPSFNRGSYSTKVSGSCSNTLECFHYRQHS